MSRSSLRRMFRDSREEIKAEQSDVLLVDEPSLDDIADEWDEYVMEMCGTSDAIVLRPNVGCPKEEIPWRFSLHDSEKCGCTECVRWRSIETYVPTHNDCPDPWCNGSSASGCIVRRDF